MFRFDIRGYDYDEARIIDHKVVGYCYPPDVAPDGKPGLLTHVNAARSGSTSKNRIFVGFDTKGCLSVLWGQPNAANYFVGLVVDGQFFHGGCSVAQEDYRIEMNNSSAPAAGANTGFGLVNLIEV